MVNRMGMQYDINFVHLKQNYKSLHITILMLSKVSATSILYEMFVCIYDTRILHIFYFWLIRCQLPLRLQPTHY